MTALTMVASVQVAAVKVQRGAPGSRSRTLEIHTLFALHGRGCRRSGFAGADQALGDFFLQSGFESQYYGVSEFDPDQTMEMLRQAILHALAEGDLLPEDLMEELTKARFGQERGAIA